MPCFEANSKKIFFLYIFSQKKIFFLKMPCLKQSLAIQENYKISNVHSQQGKTFKKNFCPFQPCFRIVWMISANDQHLNWRNSVTWLTWESNLKNSPTEGILSKDSFRFGFGEEKIELFPPQSRHWLPKGVEETYQALLSEWMHTESHFFRSFIITAKCVR